MSELDPNIPKLLDLRQKDQERRLLSLQTEIRVLRQKLKDLDLEQTKLDASQDAFARMSVENGYLRYMQHRRELLIRQIDSLNQQAETVQNGLRQSVFSQSVLQDLPRT